LNQQVRVFDGHLEMAFGHARERHQDPQFIAVLEQVDGRLPASPLRGTDLKKLALQALGILQHRQGLGPHPGFRVARAHCL